MLIKEKIKRPTFIINQNKIWADKYFDFKNSDSNLYIEYNDNSKVFYKKNVPHELFLSKKDMELLALNLIVNLELMQINGNFNVRLHDKEISGLVEYIETEEDIKISFSFPKRVLLLERIRKVNEFTIRVNFDGYTNLFINLIKTNYNIEPKRKVALETIKNFILNKAIMQD